MSVDYYCMLGKVPKVLSYVRNGQYVHTICKLNDNVDSFYGVRPAIVLKPNIKYIYGGNGDYNNPYRLSA